MSQCRQCVVREAGESGLCPGCEERVARLRAVLAKQADAPAAAPVPKAAARPPAVRSVASSSDDAPPTCVQCERVLQADKGDGPIRCAECIAQNKRDLKDFMRRK